jgi:hypothetical protein
MLGVAILHWVVLLCLVPILVLHWVLGGWWWLVRWLGTGAVGGCEGPGGVVATVTAGGGGDGGRGGRLGVP